MRLPLSENNLPSLRDTGSRTCATQVSGIGVPPRVDHPGAVPSDEFAWYNVPIQPATETLSMATYFAVGSPTTDLSHDDLKTALVGTFDKLGPKEKVLALPPDFTRFNSMAGPLTCMAHEYYGEKLRDVMPALGTHVPMPDWQLEKMFPGVPKSLIRDHDWRNDVLTIGEVPAEFVSEATEGIYAKPWPAQAQPAGVAGWPRSDPLDRPGRPARSDRHGQLQQKSFRRHRRRLGHQRKPFHRSGLRHGTDDGSGRHAAAPYPQLRPRPVLQGPAAAVHSSR